MTHELKQLKPLVRAIGQVECSRKMHVCTAQRIWKMNCQTPIIACIIFVDVLLSLMTASIALDEGVAPTLLQLLQCALCGSATVKATSQDMVPPRQSIKPKKDDTEQTEG